jgi:upstream activation factor subunit UAF30
MATTTDAPVTLDALMKELKAVRKEIRKIRQHIEDPTGEKQEARTKNNGFNKPQKVTDALRGFLSLGPEEMISRSQVSNHMNKYFETHGLKAGQKITMDDKLKALLEVPEGVQLTFLNLQHYLSKHYIKDETAEKKPRAKKAAPAAAPPTEGATAAAAEPPKEKKVRPKVAKPAATA